MSEQLNTCLSPGWMHPGDVMKSHKLKAKRRALQARMSKSLPLQILLPAKKTFTSSLISSSKRRNPFRCVDAKVQKLDEHDADSSENSSDGTLFQLLHNKPAESAKQKPYELQDILRKDITADSSLNTTVMPTAWPHALPVDWCLKSKIRFFSIKPLPWKHTFKTIEEASGTTGFVRCLKAESSIRDERKLDTTANAKFYECCLVWQYPALPGISLFPRDRQKISTNTGMYVDHKIASELHLEWGESLRSLYQLIRVRQCPYFYVCAHNFTCLFRAAGAGGVPQTHALITPTTRGFRDVMRKEGIEFSMPFLNKSHDNVSEDTFGDDSEENYDLENADCLEEDIECEESSSFLEDLGLEASQFPGLNQTRIKNYRESKKFKSIDGSPQSLVYVEDTELQGLINFLLNCSSCVVSTGALAGVPPTLFSPVAFQGGSLKSLKISGGLIRNSDGEMQNSIEIRGPILPTAMLHLTSLLSSSVDAYSVSLISVPSTMSFSSFLLSSNDTCKKLMPLAFASEGLIDCGLGKEIRSAICGSSVVHTDLNQEVAHPKCYKEIIFKEGKYKWT